ncbi:hypothetical protein A8U91_01346 [Halomonas elongata]|uniref:Uncharacterized protein n=1 Tax=Halomonas elongata TaxID=2746 RepID=A0A1B8P435_HALEL|nr:hypothetical protein [Halomonas elongata]OBX36998.1 hypothetical protein A8U91_01346 [Halomonas elongata]
MDIDFGGTVEGSDKVLTRFQMNEDTEEGLFQCIEIDVWVPDIDSLSERQRHTKQEALEMLRRAVTTLEQDLGE